MTDEFLPIESRLQKVLVHNEVDHACYRLVILSFTPTSYLVLQPLANSDRLGISSTFSYERRKVLRSLSPNPAWSLAWIGKKLQSAHIATNQQESRNYVVFNFEQRELIFIAHNLGVKIFYQPLSIPQLKKTKVGLAHPNRLSTSPQLL